MDYLNDTINLTMDVYESALKDTVNYALQEFNRVRAGRVSPNIIERVTVDYYGTPTILRDMSTITNEDARTLSINVWDVAMRTAVCGALASANLGANPIDNGQVIRMIFPQLTEERRKELVKQVKTLAENARVAMRNERRDAISEIRKTAKSDNFGEDDIKSMEGDVQKLLDNYIANLDNLLAKKEAEIMEV